MLKTLRARLAVRFAAFLGVPVVVLYVGNEESRRVASAAQSVAPIAQSERLPFQFSQFTAVWPTFIPIDDDSKE